MGILMLRHTQPAVAPGTCYGQLNLDVADTFEVEAKRALQNLPPILQIITSPLQRCRKLAEFVGAALTLPVVIDARLQEMDFGTWEGRAWNDIPRAELDAWAQDFLHARPHGGESVADLKARADQAVADLDPSQGDILLVTHAGIVRALFAKGPDAHHFQTDIDYGGLLRFPHNKEAPG